MVFRSDLSATYARAPKSVCVGTQYSPMLVNWSAGDWGKKTLTDALQELAGRRGMFWAPPAPEAAAQPAVGTPVGSSSKKNGD
jgi:hypothetical protein